MTVPPDYGMQDGRAERLEMGIEPAAHEPGMRGRGRLVQDDNAAHAPGEVCELCGQVIEPS